MEHACATITVCFEEPFGSPYTSAPRQATAPSARSPSVPNPRIMRSISFCWITGGICPSVRLSQWNTRNGNASTPNGHSGR